MILNGAVSFTTFFRNTCQAVEIHKDSKDRIDDSLMKNVFRTNEIVIAYLDFLSCFYSSMYIIVNARRLEFAFRFFQILNGAYLLDTLNEKRLNLQTMLHIVSVLRIAALFAGFTALFQIGVACIDLNLRIFLWLNPVHSRGPHLA